MPAKRKPGQPSEAAIQRTVVELLEWDGWRAFRTEHAIERKESGGFKRRVGEVGMPDYLFIRYTVYLGGDTWNWEGSETMSNVLWVEFKALGEKPDKDQLAWHAAERQRGAMVLVVDSIDGFQAWYAASGLKRR